uniref:ATP-dependent protease proteolytic subunit n=1 Tax=Verbena officinalis TaxID=79772 RepID=A0A898CTU6_VEROI|nr:ATP-dependent protease proteolytic subunit [Verbena officinalis]
MPLGLPKVPFLVPGDEEVTWVEFLCDLSDILGHMGFPRSLPRSRYPLFRPRKRNEIIQKLEREVQFNALLGEFIIIFSIRIIYGKLKLDKKNEVSRLRLEKTQLGIYLKFLRVSKRIPVLLFVKSKHNKKKWKWEDLSYMCKSKSGGSLPGVEHKPKKMKETHSGTRKYHRDLDKISMKQYINEKLIRKVSKLFLFKGRKKSKFVFIEKSKKKKKPFRKKFEKTCYEKEKEKRKRTGIYTLILFFSQFFLNRMHQKVHVRFLRDTILP